MKGTILTIGDEILIGQIIDTNSAWLGNAMSNLGIQVKSIVSISDTKAAIHAALDQALEHTDLIIMTGGLGPTKDDITKKALVDYFDSEMYFDQELRDRIAAYFETRGIPFLKSHEEQFFMPSKAKILFNKMGTAPGMLFEHEGKYILSMPGVPYEMKWIFSNSFLPEFHKVNDNKQKIYHKTIKTVGRGETQIAETIEDLIEDFPPGLSIAYLPSLGSVRLRISSISMTDQSAIVDSFVDKIANRIPDIIYGYDDISLAESLQELCISKGLTVSTAESCTGGYLAHKLTAIPGSSKYYMGSIIAYDYEPKKKLLGVSNTTLEKTGAVSEETVTEMLIGLLDKFGTDLGVAISGIAGPGGGLPDKPVGTIWMAWGTKDNIRTYKLQLAKDRIKNIEYTAVSAMNALRKFVNKNY